MSDITVAGNIGEPALRFTPSGKSVLEFSLAQNHSKKNQSGGWEDDGVTWRKVSIWDKKAEALSEVLRKGDRVLVTGSERLREWEAKDGTKGKTLELNARDIGIIPRAEKSEGGGWESKPATGTNTWGEPETSEPPF